MLARAPASPAQGLQHHGSWYFDFPYFCMMCGVEKRGLVDKNSLERDLYALLLRTYCTSFWNYVEDNWASAGELSAANSIGTQ